jgi:hypothetical protein
MMILTDNNGHTHHLSKDDMGGGINLFLSSSFQCQGGTHLVSDEPDAATNLWGDGTFESALAKEAVDCLDLVPT